MKEKNEARLTFGVVVDWIVGWGDVNYYQTNILSGVGDFTKENDINLICLITGRLDSPFEWERSRNILFDFINKNRIDGLIILAAAVGFCTTKKRVLELLKKYQAIPVITINESYEGYHCVSVNNHAGMRQVVDHLIEIHNCRHIAFIKGPEENREAQVRFEAYLEALKCHELTYNPDLVYQGDFLFNSGSEAVKNFLDERKIQFDALVAANDNMAIGAMSELSKKTGEIPGNLPVAGFDDAEISKFFSLTTVRQSFYDQAKYAASMLLKLIRGESVATKVEIPTSMLIRASCGCMSSQVRNAFINDYRISTEPFTVSFQNNKNLCISELQAINQTIELSDDEVIIDAQELLDYEQMALEALYDEIVSGQKNKFLNTWNTIIFWAIIKKVSLFTLQAILSAFRKFTYICLDDPARITNVEDVFHAARIQIGEAIQRIGTSLNQFSYLQTDSLDRFSEELIAFLDCGNQMELIYKKLPEFGIKKCYISLYEEPADPLKFSRLILAFTEDGRFNTSVNGLRFATRDFLPDDIMTDLQKKRFSIIIQALYQGDNQLGFAIFGYDTKIEKAFEIVRYRLSVALRGALLIEKIKQQAQDLEKQVIERTKDLSRTNQQLEQEIAKRKKAEIKLKRALKKLETYNQELHHQSLRDELTGLYNRRGFMTLGTQHYTYAKRTNKGFLILFADLDGLKQINDRFGHIEGDNALLKTTQILNETFRNMDIVARLAGDEFTILVADALPRDEKHIIKRLYQLFDRYNQKSMKSYSLSISIGSTYFDPGSSLSFDELLIRADKSLYDEKQRKKDLILF
jgi:diguanylate cyclase (GGDEF)-like protein